MTTHITSPTIAVIVAVDNQRGFAKQGKIPWHYSEDFKWFKKITDGQVCVMGRNTYEEIHEKTKDSSPTSVLPGRLCYVISNTLTVLPNATVVKSLTEVSNDLIRKDIFDKRIFVIGGKQLYIEGVSMADVVYVTVINKDYNCDMFFPIEYVTRHFAPPRVFRGSDEDLRFLIYNRIK